MSIYCKIFEKKCAEILLFVSISYIVTDIKISLNIEKQADKHSTQKLSKLTETMS